eukprot:CAMPEP_0119106502 /NCGR_PEP_ID=MMETSP1180-20130426/4500_1 /TAXON_ID=3052 ORGANISM="Chlamydomonas cf sp, Strain CCMP681" /NCGR_SAMPLE_ID=MMETSP1180 /ASSEMBLY_ACC=CAM_ASM_000741 /LENGTH=35 /DNA_ID= /DNA_START= /DNA_END= /DNA_ORIENTATION=
MTLPDSAPKGFNALFAKSRATYTLSVDIVLARSMG